ncbi:MAG TPA: efflux RND transporter periplasmic adaptor subunit, partial [Chloroflexota bacterium]|nr:efflux RND transporter periplasmic adaptor subunit [Chloroflexota bacterium]
MKDLASGLARWWWAALAAVVLVVWVALWGPATRAQGSEQKAPAAQAAGGIAVKTAKATEGSISANLTYTGDVKAVTQVTVQPKGSGRIEQLLVDVGSKVKKGDVIAQLDSASLKAQVSQARANLAAAQAKYAGMKSGSRDEQIAQAKAVMEAAQAAADAAEARANIVKRGATDNDIRNAQGAVDAAKANLDKARAAQETVKLGPTQEQWWAALSAVDTARATVKEAETKLADVKAGYKPADIQAQEALVEQYRAVLYAADDKKNYAGDHNYLFPDNQLTGVPGVANLGVTSASQADRAAFAALKNYDAAVAKLEQMKAYPQPADVAPFQAAVDRAKAAFDAAANRVDQMKRGPTAQDLQQAQAGADAASAALTSAQAALKKLQDGATEDDIKAADAGVSQAKSAVAQAEQAYQLAQNPYTVNDMNQSNAAVMQAQAVVDQAEIGLSEATVVSPVDGVVSDRPQAVGNLVSPATPIVAILSNDVELVLGIEESQIGQVQEGQTAQITVAAYPGVIFPARVALIAPSADAKSRTFQVKVRPDANDGKLKQGMFAQV